MSLKRKIAAAVSLHMLAWLAMLIALAGIVFLALGVFWLIAPPLGPGIAALVVGGGLLGLILVITLFGLLIARARRRTKAAAVQRSPDSRIEEELRPVIGDRATAWAKANPGITMVGALSAGVVLAASPGMRRVIYDAARPVITRKVMQVMQDLVDG
ncbi:hypothetical protein [Salinisphaera sp. LB1]|uniref:hypothetical protein n=1 Tax=Salinisphaera sp. LB1 TaxID=2183911 RepID=UPI000D7D9B51|nr:hypothetical protein [Salinisphaera sp. LB1]AWN14350.1 hypothetical protein SALB1_0143 [Salinisphaera sp. LB1]